MHALHDRDDRNYQIDLPIDGRGLRRAAASPTPAIEAAVARGAGGAGRVGARAARRAGRWCSRLDACSPMNAEIVTELAWQMGRPVRYGGEMGGVEERTALHGRDRRAGARADRARSRSDGFRRYIAREPLGIVLVIAPWNYPFLTAINTIVPALIAGNAVLLKHAAQTLLVGERFAAGLRQAGLPKGAVPEPRSRPRTRPRLIGSGASTTSTSPARSPAGRRSSARRPAPSPALGLELGGKDPAYVRDDANLEHAVENLVDGAFFNSGQCCCGIERVYVHESVYDALRRGLRRPDEEIRARQSARPGDHARARWRSARFADTCASRSAEALRKGAKALIDTKRRRATATARPTWRRRC